MKPIQERNELELYRILKKEFLLSKQNGSLKEVLQQNYLDKFY